MSEIVLVDGAGNAIGSADKLEAHTSPGQLHLAFSVFIRDPQGRQLLQRRAGSKYHFPGRWANACCSHPRPGEEPTTAAHRRLDEEMGLATELTPIGTFTYRAEDPATGLVEHELDHVYAEISEEDPSPDPDEVAEWAWVETETLERWVAEEREDLAPWVIEAVRAFPRMLR